MDSSETDGPVLVFRDTYFYVFTSPDASFPLPDDDSERLPGFDLDYALLVALSHLERDFPEEVHVTANPSDYHELRVALGIKSIPAFAVSSGEIGHDQRYSFERKRIPTRAEFWRSKERMRLVVLGIALPKVEGPLIAHLATKGRLEYFLRNLHLAHVAGGRSEVADSIEAEWSSWKGTKALEWLKEIRGSA